MADNQHTKTETDQVLTPPAGSPQHWREKVEIAKEARRQALEVRKGKPSSFGPPVGHGASRYSRSA